MVSKNNEIVNLNAAAKNPVRPSKGMAEGGCGGNSAIPLQKTEAKPAALFVESRTQQKSFLFLLEEKIRRSQNQWTALCATNQKIGQIEKSQILVPSGGIEPPYPASKAGVLSVRLRGHYVPL